MRTLCEDRSRAFKLKIEHRGHLFNHIPKTQIVFFFAACVIPQTHAQQHSRRGREREVVITDDGTCDTRVV